MYSNWIYLLVSLGLLPIARFLYLRDESFRMRIDTLEKTSISEDRVRQLLADILGPIKEDNQEIKDLVNKLIDIELSKKR